METHPQPRFVCDAMMGGLARWLRAAGYDASWRLDIDDHELLRLAQAEGRTVLTSDTGIFHFGIVRDGLVPALWLPHRLRLQQQLAFVLDRLHLPLREPRCMACGGSLEEVPRERVADRVPPRSLAWRDRFWECSRCRQVFWHGTHWQRIEAQLRQAVSPP